MIRLIAILLMYGSACSAFAGVDLVDIKFKVTHKGGAKIIYDNSQMYKLCTDGGVDSIVTVTSGSEAEDIQLAGGSCLLVSGSTVSIRPVKGNGIVNGKITIINFN